MGTKREVIKPVAAYHHSGVTLVTRQTKEIKRENRKRERERLRKNEREKARAKESTSTAERGEACVGTKREVKKACRGVPPQWCHSGDKHQRERERD